MGMSAHILFDAIDPLWPATLSPRMIDIMRRELAFDGLLMTDDLSMEALPGTIPTRAYGGATGRDRYCFALQRGRR
jgi:beta-N-acetylhexosaminidase